MTRLNDILDEAYRALAAGAPDIDALVRDGKAYTVMSLETARDLNVNGQRLKPGETVTIRNVNAGYETITPRMAEPTGPLPRVMNVSNEINQDAVRFYINGDGWYLSMDVSGEEKLKHRGWGNAFVEKWRKLMNDAERFPTFEPGARKRLDELDGRTSGSYAIVKGYETLRVDASRMETFKAKDFEWPSLDELDHGDSKSIGDLKLLVAADPRTKPHEPPLPQLFIRRGERVLWDGALICEAKIDILNTDPLDVDAFRWFVTKPKAGETAASTRGFRDVPVGGGRMVVEVFVEGAWRRPTPLSPQGD